MDNKPKDENVLPSVLPPGTHTLHLKVDPATLAAMQEATEQVRLAREALESKLSALALLVKPFIQRLKSGERVPAGGDSEHLATLSADDLPVL